MEEYRIQIGIIIFSLIAILTGGIGYGMTRKNEEDNKKNKLNKASPYILILVGFGVIMLFGISIYLAKKSCQKPEI
jgi:hypothetical protein